MAYLDGFVAPVPTHKQQAFLDHAARMDAAFIRHGATRVVECWGDDLAHGTVTDFTRAVQAGDDETVVFSWIHWPDKTTRNRAWAAMMDPANPDAAMDPARNPPPFDGKRMIFGGFEPLLTRDEHGAFPYVQGFLTPAPSTGREAYAAAAQEGWTMMEGLGALGVLEAWSDDVPRGSRTDCYRAVNASEDEAVVFSYVIWPSREICQQAATRMAEMDMPEGMALPFDPARMIYGGFQPIFDLGAQA